MLSNLFRRIRPRSVYDVFAVLAFFIAVGTGGAYAANTIRSTDIVDGEVKTADVANQNLSGGDIKDGSLTTFDLTDGAGVAGADVIDNTLTGADITDGSLKASDVGESQSVDFGLNLAAVPAHRCNSYGLTVPGGAGDHLLLTPSSRDSTLVTTYTIEYRPVNDEAELKYCNPSDTEVGPTTTHFNLLVFNAH